MNVTTNQHASQSVQAAQASLKPAERSVQTDQQSDFSQLLKSAKSGLEPAALPLKSQG